MTNLTIIEDLTLVPVPAWWQNPWILGALILVLGVIGYYGMRWLRARTVALAAEQPVYQGPPPHLEALKRLADLRTRHATLSAYEVALECPDILRHYIEQRFNLPIRYQTTREFLGVAQAHPLLDGEPRKQLGEFLKFFDQIKFARDTATPQQTLAALDAAEAFIKRCAAPAAPGGKGA